MTGRQQTQPGDLVAAPRPDHGPVATRHDGAPVAHADEALRVDEESLARLPPADLSNVIPFVRARRSGGEASVPPLTLAPADRPAPQTLDAATRAYLLIVACSLVVHCGLFALFWDPPKPLASIGTEVISVELVLGGHTEAGLAATPGETAAPSAQSAEEAKPEEQVAERQQLTTDSPQDVPVAARETAPEERPQEQATLAAAERLPEEQQPVVQSRIAMVETPTAKVPTALPKETPPDITASIAPPEQPKEEKPVAEKPRPKPPVKKKERAPERKRIAARTADEAPQRAASSVASSAASGVGRGRSDRDTNYPGIVVAHLRRHQQNRHSEQGSATVTFGLDGSGRVTSVRLSRGSGHATLDQEVQAMVRRASPFPAPPDGRPRNFTVPVRFLVQ